MKTINKVLNIAMAGMLTIGMVSCTDGNDWDVDGSYSRLFAIDPANISIEQEDVQATVTFSTMQGAEYYIIEVATDSLYDDIPMGGTNAIVYGEDKSITKSPFVITGLQGDTKYSLRIKAMSSKTAESKWAYFRDGSPFKTLAEQIFNTPEASDRSESTLRVTWMPGAAVTALVVVKGDEEEGTTITLDDAAKAAGEYVISDLQPSTSYTITIMNGDAKRGVLTMSTTAAMPDGDYKTELPAEITRITADVINDIVETAKAATGKDRIAITLGLQPDMTYDVASFAEDGGDASLALPEGISFTFFGLSGGESPVLNWKKSLDVGGGRQYIKFENIAFIDGGCQYFINQASDATMEELSFKQCTFNHFERSLIRTQGSGNINIDRIVIDDCILTDMSHANGYSVLYFGTATTNIGKVELNNSTFDTTQRSFIEASKAPVANGVFITNCTFYNNVANGRYLMDANGQSTNIVMTKTILGKSYDNEGKSRGIRTAGTMTFEECLRTSDCVYGSNDIKDLAADDRSSADIFKDPDNHDFTLKIYNKVGDPRWYNKE